MKKKKTLGYRVEKAMETPVSQEVFDELKDFIVFLEGLRDDVSKQTHYHRLSEWTDMVYGYVHEKLDAHGFINAGAAMGKTQPRDAEFWWKIYEVLSSVIYSPNLKSKAAHHHSSAWERNEALIADIRDIIKYKPKETVLKS